MTKAAPNDVVLEVRRREHEGGYGLRGCIRCVILERINLVLKCRQHPSRKSTCELKYTEYYVLAHAITGATIARSQPLKLLPKGHNYASEFRDRRV